MQLPPIARFETSGGVRLYQIPVAAFPMLTAYCYVILGAGVPTLLDTGSGFGESNDDLIRGIAALEGDFNEKIALTDIKRILISHGHIDHFGGLPFIAEQTGAQIGVHALDRRILTAYEERVIVATKDVRVYMQRAGVSDTLLDNLIAMYGFAKQHVSSVRVDFTLDEDKPLDGMRFIHAPGHCPGQVCIMIDDVLLSADHVLSHTTPHQAPESITLYTGLGHYLESLDKISRVPDIRLTLGGHEEPMPDIYGRIAATKASHDRKLKRILDAINSAEKPCTISDISKKIYDDRHGYDILLALEEIGAHVEYLYQRGLLAVCNLDQVERDANPALLYCVV